MTDTSRANLALFVTAVFWGVGFLFSRSAMAHLSPLAYSGLRFGLGALPLLAWAAPRARRELRAAADRRALLGLWTRAILAAGAFIFLGTYLQQVGLVWTTAGKAGFITSLYVVIVPFFMVLGGGRVTLGQGLGALLAVAGLYLLSGAEALSLAAGDGYVLIGAVLWALHVLVVGRYAPKMDTVILGAGQAAVCAVIALAATAFLGEMPTAEAFGASWLNVLWGGLCSVTIGFTLQVLGQRKASPAAAALILQLEAVVAALAGRLFLDEIMTPRMITGAAVMTAGVVLCQVWPLLFPAKAAPPDRPPE